MAHPRLQSRAFADESVARGRSTECNSGSARLPLTLAGLIAAGLAISPCAAAVHQASIGGGIAIAAQARHAVDDLETKRGAPALILVQTGGEFVVADLIGAVGRPIPVIIEVPPHQPTDYMLLSFRGLPEGFSLSSGFRAADAWLISVREARDLRLITPKDFVGSFDIEVQLSRGQNSDRMVQQVRVELRGQDVASSSQPAVEATSAEEKTAASPQGSVVLKSAEASETVASTDTALSARVDPAKEQEMLETAAGLLRQNDITAARLIYARLAREGSRQGALTMAQTYDPAFLSRYETTGLKADKDKAKHWYSIAASLGSADASRRLLALDAADRR